MFQYLNIVLKFNTVNNHLVLLIDDQGPLLSPAVFATNPKQTTNHFGVRETANKKPLPCVREIRG